MTVYPKPVISHAFSISVTGNNALSLVHFLPYMQKLGIEVTEITLFRLSPEWDINH